jgi:hypothetical protein
MADGAPRTPDGEHDGDGARPEGGAETEPESPRESTAETRGGVLGCPFRAVPGEPLRAVPRGGSTGGAT